MTGTQKTAGLFVKIHAVEQLTEDKISIDVEVLAVDDKGGLSSQPVELTMGGKTYPFATMANGKAKSCLVCTVNPGERQQLIAKIPGKEGAETTVEIVPPGYEAALTERIIKKTQKENQADISNLHEVFAELGQVIKDRITQKVESRNRDNIFQFYENLVRKNQFKHVAYRHKSVYEISEEIFNLHKNLKREALTLIESWPIGVTTLGTLFGQHKNAESLLKRHDVNSIEELKKKLISIPAYITDPHYKYPLKSGSSYSYKKELKGNTKELFEILYQIEIAQHYLGSLEKEIERHIPAACDFYKIIAQAIRSNSPKEMEQGIEKTIRSYPGDTILGAYSFLYADNFQSIEEVVAFEQERYSKLIKIVTEPLDMAKKILASYLESKSYKLAWVTFKQLLELIRSNEMVAEAIDLEQFESEYGDCIELLRNRFETKS